MKYFSHPVFLVVLAISTPSWATTSEVGETPVEADHQYFYHFSEADIQAGRGNCDAKTIELYEILTDKKQPLVDLSEKSMKAAQSFIDLYLETYQELDSPDRPSQEQRDLLINRPTNETAWNLFKSGCETGQWERTRSCNVKRWAPAGNSGEHLIHGLISNTNDDGTRIRFELAIPQIVEFEGDDYFLVAITQGTISDFKETTLSSGDLSIVRIPTKYRTSRHVPEFQHNTSWGEPQQDATSVAHLRLIDGEINHWYRGKNHIGMRGPVLRFANDFRQFCTKKALANFELQATQKLRADRKKAKEIFLGNPTDVLLDQNGLSPAK